MKRLPRKRKKQVKKVVERKTASKMIMCALTAASAHAQTAIIASQPISIPQVGIAHKAVRTAMVMVDTAVAIQRILSEPPNSWREFIK
jgi:hypothetical protein